MQLYQAQCPDTDKKPNNTNHNPSVPFHNMKPSKTGLASCLTYNYIIYPTPQKASIFTNYFKTKYLHQPYTLTQIYTNLIENENKNQ